MAQYTKENTPGATPQELYHLNVDLFTTILAVVGARRTLGMDELTTDELTTFVKQHYARHRPPEGAPNAYPTQALPGPRAPMD